MKRFIVNFLIVLILIMNTFCCSAEMVGDFEINVTEGGTSVIYSYHGSEAAPDIPASVNMYGETFPLTTIYDEAFIYNTDLKTIVIPEGVDYIGYRTFYGCENLETVVLPSTIRQIEEEAFAYCTSLAQINLPDELFYAGENIFSGCNMLQLTQEEKDVLIYTEHAAHMAQQAAFVVDTENLVDLSEYLGTSFDAFVEMMGDMDDLGYTDGIGYANYDVSISSNYTYYNGEVIIEGIDLSQKSNYCLMGVYVSMDSQDAMKTLLKAGWKMTDKWEIGSSFEDPNGNSISFWINDDNSINSVVLYMNYDIAYEISEGNYDVANLFVYSDSESTPANNTTSTTVASSTAYTTGNVNLRTGPGLGYDTAGSIPPSTYIEYLGESSIDERGVAWYYVSYNGKTGWSSSKYVDLQ